MSITTKSSFSSYHFLSSSAFKYLPVCLRGFISFGNLVLTISSLTFTESFGKALPLPSLFFICKSLKRLSFIKTAKNLSVSGVRPSKVMLIPSSAIIALPLRESPSHSPRVKIANSCGFLIFIYL